MQYQTQNQKQTPTTCTILIFIRNGYRGCCKAIGRIPPAADDATRRRAKRNDAPSRCTSDACSRRTRRVRRLANAWATSSECVGDIHTHTFDDIRTNISCIAATDVMNAHWRQCSTAFSGVPRFSKATGDWIYRSIDRQRTRARTRTHTPTTNDGAATRNKSQRGRPRQQRIQRRWRHGDACDK